MVNKPLIRPAISRGGGSPMADRLTGHETMVCTGPLVKQMDLSSPLVQPGQAGRPQYDHTYQVFQSDSVWTHKWPFSGLKWPPFQESKGHFEEDGIGPLAKKQNYLSHYYRA